MDERQKAKIKFIAILVSVLLVLATIVGLVIWFLKTTKKDIPNAEYNNITENIVKNEIAENTVQPGNTAEDVILGDKYKVWLNNDGTASVKVNSDIKIWEDELSLTAENEEEKIEALKRKIILENVVQTRTIEIKDKKIVKIFVLDKFNNDISYEARAVAKCDDKTYYLVDLIGKNTLAKYPVVIQELTKIEDKEIQSFVAKSDTSVKEDMTILNYDVIFAKVSDIESIKVYDSRDLTAIINLIEEKYSNDENIQEITVSDIKVENIVGKLNEDDILEGDYLVFTANYSIKYKVYSDVIGELVRNQRQKTN